MGSDELWYRFIDGVTRPGERPSREMETSATRTILCGWVTVRVRSYVRVYPAKVRLSPGATVNSVLLANAVEAVMPIAASATPMWTISPPVSRRLRVRAAGIDAAVARPLARANVPTERTNAPAFANRTNAARPNAAIAARSRTPAAARPTITPAPATAGIGNRRAACSGEPRRQDRHGPAP